MLSWFTLLFTGYIFGVVSFTCWLLQVIFKMDRYGKGEEILLDKVFTSVLCGLSFRHFDKKLFTGKLPESSYYK